MIPENEKMTEIDRDEGFLAVHEDVVKRVLDTQPADEYLYELADIFKVFGDSTRIKILFALFESELCVGDLARLLGLSQSAVSHQLKTLKEAKLVRFRRDGKIFPRRRPREDDTLHGYGTRRRIRRILK